MDNEHGLFKTAPDMSPRDKFIRWHMFLHIMLYPLRLYTQAKETKPWTADHRRTRDDRGRHMFAIKILCSFSRDYSSNLQCTRCFGTLSPSMSFYRSEYFKLCSTRVGSKVSGLLDFETAPERRKPIAVRSSRGD